MFLRNLNDDILENRINIFINGNNMVIISDSNNSDLEYVTIFNRHYKLYPTDPFKVDSDIVFNLEKTINYFRIEEIVINIDITINDFCNMNCAYCGSNKDSKGRVISLESLTNILDKWITYFKTNNINVTLLGGEVTLLSDDYLKEILNLVENKITGNIVIYTNLKKTSNEIKDFLKRNRRSNLIVSIDGLDDRISERTIEYSEIVKNLLFYEDMGKITINSVLSMFKLDKYGLFIKEMKGYGIKSFRLKQEINNMNISNKLNMNTRFNEEIERLVNEIKNEKLLLSSLMYHTCYWSDYDTKDDLPVIVQVLNKIDRDDIYELYR